MVKRFLDLVVSLASLIALSPLFVVVAVLVRLNLGSPVLFRQVRPGKDAKPFQMVKFRTMRSGDCPDEARLTPFGRWLRSTSLDELPELWSVLKGDMSLVGPRPLLVDYLPLYTARQARRHDVRPGVTGWAQVNGRNAIGWPERFALDLWYVDNRSLWLDVKIIWRTVACVFARKGVTADGCATMGRFTG